MLAMLAILVLRLETEMEIMKWTNGMPATDQQSFSRISA